MTDKSPNASAKKTGQTLKQKRAAKKAKKARLKETAAKVPGAGQ